MTPRITPVLPSADLIRDIQWYQDMAGFSLSSSDDLYAVLHREDILIHLQWHADTADDPLLGGSVIKIFVEDIQPYYEEFVERGAITIDQLHRNTAWGTHEFGFYDQNKNALFFVQDI